MTADNPGAHPKKVLCVIDSLTSGGAQRQLVGIATGLRKRGFDVSFLTYQNKPFFAPALEYAGIAATCIDEPGYVRRFLKMRRFIRKGDYDAVLSFLGGANVICECAGLPRRSWRLVVGERSADPHILTSPRLRAYRWFHVLADTIISNSTENLEIVRRVNPFIRVSRCKLIYNAVDLETWRPSGDYVPRKNGKLAMVVLAGHRYKKNLSGLLDALLLLEPEERAALRIEWYGEVLDGSFEQGKQKIRDHALEPVITLLPDTQDILEIVQQCDIVGLFSFFEGFPNAVCEAMACAKPVICSRIQDVPVLLAHTADLLCDPHDPVSIRDTIRRASSLSDQELRERGSLNRLKAGEYFDKERISAKYAELLTK